VNCNCIKLTNEKLAEMNMALDTSFLLGEDLSLSGQTLSIGTHWKDPAKKVRGKRPTTIIVNYCPFCGVKASKDEEEKTNAEKSDN
jgi:hypothetical protein